MDPFTLLSGVSSVVGDDGLGLFKTKPSSASSGSLSQPIIEQNAPFVFGGSADDALGQSNALRQASAAALPLVGLVVLAWALPRVLKAL